MDVELLKVVGQVAGIGGLALGVLLVLFRDIIRKNIFPMLPPGKAYQLLRLITVAVWSLAIMGVVAWVFVTVSPTREARAETGGIAISGDVTGSTVENQTK